MSNMIWRTKNEGILSRFQHFGLCPLYIYSVLPESLQPKISLTSLLFVYGVFVDKAEHGTIGSWLTSIGLGQYENVLIINGFDNIKMLVSTWSY